MTQLLIQPVDYFLLAWFTLSATSVLYIEVGPGQRYDVIWVARNPGKWLNPLPHSTPYDQ